MKILALVLGKFKRVKCPPCANGRDQDGLTPRREGAKKTTASHEIHESHEIGVRSRQRRGFPTIQEFPFVPFVIFVVPNPVFLCALRALA